MSNAMVSVVVPIYKTEKYLSFCLESILNQTWDNIEIILVDDESPDSCPAICDAYAAKYAHIKVIHKKNQGRGPARNSGLEMAEGQYIYFIDSDDALEDKYTIEKLVMCAEEKRADIIVGSFRRFNEDYESNVNYHYLREGEYTKTGEFRFRGFYQYGHLAYNWGKLYRKDFLIENNIKCPSYQFTQDKAMNMRCYACQPVYAFIEDSVYRYRDNDESITYQYKKNFIPVWTAIASDFAEFIDFKESGDEYRDLIDFHLFFGSFFLAKQELIQERGLFRARKQLKEYGKNPYVSQAMLNLAKGKYRKNLPGLGWKLLIRCASALFYIHGYLLFAFGIAILRTVQMDKQITKRRYQK